MLVLYLVKSPLSDEDRTVLDIHDRRDEAGYRPPRR